MNLFWKRTTAIKDTRSSEGQEKYPQIISFPNGRTIIDPNISGPKEQFVVSAPNGHKFRITSEKTPTGIKGMADGSPAQLSVVIKDLESNKNEEIKLTHCVYVFFLKVDAPDLQSSLKDFATAVDNLKKTDTFVKGITKILGIKSENLLIEKGEMQILEAARTVDV